MEFFKNKELCCLSIVIDGIIYSEAWVDMMGYEDIYQVSTFGRVKSKGRNIWKGARNAQCIFQKEKILSQALDYKGYPVVCVCKDGTSKRKFVHRLVAIHFIENERNRPQVNHKSGIKTFNMVHLLEWATNSENQLHSIGMKLRVPVRAEEHWNYGKTGHLCHNYGKRKGVLNNRSLIFLDQQTGVFYETLQEVADFMGMSYASLSKNRKKLLSKTNLINI